jgi:hypothetical protein
MEKWGNIGLGHRRLEFLFFFGRGLMFLIVFLTSTV